MLEPKVFIPHEVKPGHVPRRVAVKRKKQEYVSQSVAELLEEAGVTRHNVFGEGGAEAGSFANLLPLGMFDNSSYDMYTPEEVSVVCDEKKGKGMRRRNGSPPFYALLILSPTPAPQWISKGTAEGASEASVPARALWVQQHVQEWRPCTATAYDSVEGQFRVRWEHNGETTMLPRLALCFDVEDPKIFGTFVGVK